MSVTNRQNLFLGLSVASALLAAACAEVPRTENSSPLTSRIDNYVRELVELNMVPGLALGVVHKGEVVYEGYYGVEALDTKAAVTSDTIFRRDPEAAEDLSKMIRGLKERIDDHVR